MQIGQPCCTSPKWSAWQLSGTSVKDGYWHSTAGCILLWPCTLSQQGQAVGDSGSRKQGQKKFPRKPGSSEVTMKLKQFKNSPIQPTTFSAEQKSGLHVSYFWFSHQNAFVFGPEASLSNPVLGEEPSLMGIPSLEVLLLHREYLCSKRNKQSFLLNQKPLTPPGVFACCLLQSAVSCAFMAPWQHLPCHFSLYVFHEHKGICVNLLFCRWLHILCQPLSASFFSALSQSEGQIW